MKFQFWSVHSEKVMTYGAFSFGLDIGTDSAWNIWLHVNSQDYEYIDMITRTFLQISAVYPFTVEIKKI